MKRETFSLLTPVGRDREWLRAGAETVAELAEELAPDFSIRWILSSDGPAPARIIELVTTGLSGGPPVELVVLDPVELPTTTYGRAALARNRGLEFLEGRFVGFLDDDDLLNADGYASMVRTAYAGDVHWVIGRHQMLVNDQLVSPTLAEPPARGRMRAGWLRTWMVELRVQPFVGAAGIVDRECFIAQGGFPVIPYHQDTQLWLDLTDAQDGEMIDETVYVWRRHDDQMTPKEPGKRAPMWR